MAIQTKLKKVNNDKKFPLRITNKSTYPALEKEAQGKPGRWSVNTLINSILEDHQRKAKANKEGGNVK